ncbi:hypothetical protein MUBE_05725 [Mycobacterium uberis]|uniref:Uncharacterized protein n=1 Tax=Mycobacterium uberis TaxID=2162698 RepID=A0A3E1HJ00_9MYCO|nr:hypothetical protein [Mycobacterium uberis]RFD26367.1 hypothetical protein MUBE_05725 [Mycobacterium uberis]
MPGRELRLVNVSSSDEVRLLELSAWVHYDSIAIRDDLVKVLVSYFTGHLGIATTMRADRGIDIRQAHLTVFAVPMMIWIVFHKPVRWRGSMLYTYESTRVGAGRACVSGTVHVQEGALLVFFVQESLIWSLRTSDAEIDSWSRF